MQGREMGPREEAEPGEGPGSDRGRRSQVREVKMWV